jgi:hypothetical protein
MLYANWASDPRPANSALPAVNLNGEGGLLALSRRNASMFMAVVIFQDVVWLILHRLLNSDYWRFYQVSQFTSSRFALYVVLALAVWLIAALFCQRMKVISKVQVSVKVFYAVYAVTILLNLALLISVAANARYVSGGLTGTAGVIYGVSRSMNFASMVLLVRQRIGINANFSFLWAGAVVGSFALTIDGLASAMTLSAFCLLLVRDISFRNAVMVLLGTSAVATVLFLGFSRKFTELPSYMTPEYFLHWTVARLSISAEQGYTYISGESILNLSGQYVDIISRSISYRMDVLMGRVPIMLSPRSVSEAFYYDMYGVYDAGSSPGFYLGLIINGLFAIPILYLFCFVFVQMFAGMAKRFSVIYLYAFALLVKMIYGNISEYLVLISPTSLALVLFYVFCLVEQKPGSKQSLAS